MREDAADRLSIAAQLLPIHLHTDQAGEHGIAWKLHVRGHRCRAVRVLRHRAHAKSLEPRFGAPQLVPRALELPAEDAGELLQVLLLQVRGDGDEALRHHVHHRRDLPGIRPAQLEPQEIPIRVRCNLEALREHPRSLVRGDHRELHRSPGREHAGWRHPGEAQFRPDRVPHRAMQLHEMLRVGEREGMPRRIHHEPVDAGSHAVLYPERRERVRVAGPARRHVEALSADHVLQHDIRLQQVDPAGGDRQLALPDGPSLPGVPCVAGGYLDPYRGARQVGRRQQQ